MKEGNSQEGGAAAPSKLPAVGELEQLDKPSTLEAAGRKIPPKLGQIGRSRSHVSFWEADFYGTRNEFVLTPGGFHSPLRRNAVKPVVGKVGSVLLCHPFDSRCHKLNEANYTACDLMCAVKWCCEGVW